MIPTLKAITFFKVLNTGRTCPCLMLCEDSEGTQIETVVKLISGNESTPTGLVCELMASLFAQDLDIVVPTPFLIEIDADFYEGMTNAELADRFRSSRGLNFGSQYFNEGYTTWPLERDIPASLIPIAADIFAFDLIIQNPDRRKEKPNLLRKGDEIVILDHEMAFSFLRTLFHNPNEYPWLDKGINFIKDHIFYSSLKGKRLSWDRLQGALEAVDDNQFKMYINSVPAEWRLDSDDPAVKICSYLKQARDNSNPLFQLIREVLK
jgi:hypothetical protein